MLTLMICLTVLLVAALVYQHSGINRLKDRNETLRQDRRGWFENYLKANRKLRKTQEICNVAFENVLRYKRELAETKTEMKSGGGTNEAKIIEVKVESFDPATIRLVTDKIVTDNAEEKGTTVDLGIVGSRIVDGVVKLDSDEVSTCPKEGAVS